MTRAIPAGANMATISSSLSPPITPIPIPPTPPLTLPWWWRAPTVIAFTPVALIVAVVVIVVVVVAIGIFIGVGVVFADERLVNTGGRKSIMSSRK